MARLRRAIRFVRRELNVDDERDEQFDSPLRTNTIGNLIAIGVCLLLGVPAYLLWVVFYR